MPCNLKKACHQCISKIASNACFLSVFSAFLALQLSMAFTGMKFLEDCPIQPLIPLYLIVGGIMGTWKVSLLLYKSIRMRRLLSKAVVIDDDDDDDDEYPWRQNLHEYYIHLSLSLFFFLWFILGNHWVFSVYLPDFIPPFWQSQAFSDKVVYLTAEGVLGSVTLCCR